MGSLCLRPSCAAWCAQARHRVCHGHREEEMATLTSTSLHVLGAKDSGEGGAGMVADVHKLHISLTQPFFLHVSQREDMKHAKGRCQGPFSEHVFPRCGSPMQRCPLPHLMLSWCALDAFGGRKTFLAVKGCYERNSVVFKQMYAFETFTAGMQQADVNSDSKVDHLHEYEHRIYAAQKAG